MALTTLNGENLKELLAGGMDNLRLNAATIDDLNVFPIPDGDTGNNMAMTITGGVSAVAELNEKNVSKFTKKFSRGALLGARGNSGVILSQFFKGFAMGCEGVEELDIAAFSAAMGAGVKRAYESVITPTEGTILTVMREGWEFISKQEGIADFSEYFSKLNKRMDVSLENTPELLPILKESGVIDSGGAGFICIFRGMEKVINGEKIEGAEVLPSTSHSSGTLTVDPSKFNADTELEFGYCTEFILQLQNAKTDIPSFDLNEQIVAFLESVGDSIVAIMDEDLVKVHVHTFTPGVVLNYVQQYGEFVTLKIENMMIQHNETSMVKKEAEAKQIPHKDIAVVTVVNGDGLKELFTDMGVDVCVDGGQTENPSTENFLDAFKNINADHIIVLPGNSNIVMAASQAAELYKDSDVRVVKAKTIAEVYSALSMMDLEDGDVDRVIGEMQECIDHVKTGLITTSIRDVQYENIAVTKGHYIGLDREHIISDSEDRLQAVRDLINGTEGIQDLGVMCVFYGEDVSEEEVEALDSMIQSEFGWLEYGLIPGGQKIYDYIFAIE